MPQKKPVTKEEAATVQLDTAIKLYFENRDSISTHTLASAAMGVIDDVYQKNRNKILAEQVKGAASPKKVSLRFSYNEEWALRAKPEHKKEVFRRLNASQNFFKHADKDPDAVHEFNAWDECGIRIFMMICDFRLVFDKLSPATNAFYSIYLIVHPKLLNEGVDVRQEIEEFRKSLGWGKEWVPTQAQISYAGRKNLKSACPENVLGTRYRGCGW